MFQADADLVVATLVGSTVGWSIFFAVFFPLAIYVWMPAVVVTAIIVGAMFYAKVI